MGASVHSVESTLMPLLASGFGSMMPLLLVLIVFLGLMSFMTRRQAKKQQEARASLENGLRPGTRVVLTSGIFCTIDTLGDKQAWVELAPGCKIVVLKAAITRVVDDDEEEFIVEDDVTPVPGSTEPTVPAEEASDGATNLVPEGSATGQEYPSAGEDRA